MAPSVPEIEAGGEIHDLLAEVCAAIPLAELESEAASGELTHRVQSWPASWAIWTRQVQQLYLANDHVVIRGLPVTQDGNTLLLSSLVGGQRFRTYRGLQVVKKFRMSPWTQDLSHTTQEGDFHTDLNTETQPPALTAIQCLEPDPGAPQYGQNRVARLPDLLSHLTNTGQTEFARHLTETTVTMANGREREWHGTMVQGDSIRYHPTTLRAARQTSEFAPVLEELIRTVHAAAIEVSAPFGLQKGDTLLVSNHRALHYRGECSVLFDRFPTDYRSRAIFVLHQLDEPR